MLDQQQVMLLKTLILLEIGYYHRQKGWKTRFLAAAGTTAQVNRSIYTPEAFRLTLSRDYHAPAEYRVNGVVRNIDAWYKAFDINPEDSLYLSPEKRVRIW